MPCAQRAFVVVEDFAQEPRTAPAVGEHVMVGAHEIETAVRTQEHVDAHERRL
jgi:hypothetical protein